MKVVRIISLTKLQLLIKIQAKAKKTFIDIRDEIRGEGQINVTPSWPSDQSLMMGMDWSQGPTIHQNRPQIQTKPTGRSRLTLSL